MNRFTPGDWFYEGPNEGGRVLANDEIMTIVHCPTCSPFNEQAIADAILFAFSKRIYGELKKMHEHFCYTDESDGQAGAIKSAQDLLDEIDATMERF